MKENSKTKQKIWKLVNIKEIWKKLTEQDKDEEIEEIENTDTDEFFKNLRVIEEKMEKKEATKSKNKEYYKSVEVKQVEKNSRNVDRERD